MEPAGHTFPTDHQYVYYANPSAPGNTTLNVVAPSNLTIWMIYQSSGSDNEVSLWIQPCAEVIGRLGSMTSIASDIAAAAGPINQHCSTFGSYTQCQAETNIQVSAGHIIGTINSQTEYALDWWLWDTRSSLHFTDPGAFSSGPQIGFTEANIVPASAYFTPSLASQIAAKLGNFTQQRTAAPLGGTIAVDVDATAAGHWFNASQGNSENYGAALAPDEVSPTTTQVLSLGQSQPNRQYGTRLNFSFAETGTVNRDFATVTADGNIYCYQGIVENTAGQTWVALVQLLDSSTLEVEVVPTASACTAVAPYAFSANAFTYKR